ncbi:hypothetical protein ANCDUO_07530 [Ancylostoma duodenale]|uniref:Uncharacterized protein n=1 Tax=Ancylostoma duodenale TaxID=51022 RepID=A0A0C2CYS0_9BILA|nr:hypothetical protein ANCDUO_07530 [Ancylostoma duodenale]
MVRPLHEVLQGKIQCSSFPSSGQNPLDDSGTREGQMEGLLAPARYIRRSTGVKACVHAVNLVKTCKTLGKFKITTFSEFKTVRTFKTIKKESFFSSSDPYNHEEFSETCQRRQ